MRTRTPRPAVAAYRHLARWWNEAHWYGYWAPPLLLASIVYAVFCILLLSAGQP